MSETPRTCDDCNKLREAECVANGCLIEQFAPDSSPPPAPSPATTPACRQVANGRCDGSCATCADRIGPASDAPAPPRETDPAWLLTRARSALECYGRHHHWCDYRKPIPDGKIALPCNCGYEDAIRDADPGPRALLAPHYARINAARGSPLAASPAQEATPPLSAATDAQLAASFDAALADLALAERYEHNAHLVGPIRAWLDRIRAEQASRAAPTPEASATRETIPYQGPNISGLDGPDSVYPAEASAPEPTCRCKVPDVAILGGPCLQCGLAVPAETWEERNARLAAPAREASTPPTAHACPTCREWCVCAEFYDGEPCQCCAPAREASTAPGEEVLTLAESLAESRALGITTKARPQRRPAAEVERDEELLKDLEASYRADHHYANIADHPAMKDRVDRDAEGVIEPIAARFAQYRATVAALTAERAQLLATLHQQEG